MSDRAEWFDVNVPAAVLAASPMTFPLVFPQGAVDKIRMIVPYGPAGNVGLQLWVGGSQYLPRTPGSYIVADNYTPEWDVRNTNTSGSWQLVAYNTDIWPHLIQVAFDVSELDRTVATPFSGYVAV